eukprot:scaffold547732_cov32-Prasinocladus_malaysianus.AAC.1
MGNVAMISSRLTGILQIDGARCGHKPLQTRWIIMAAQYGHLSVIMAQTISLLITDRLDSRPGRDLHMSCG